MFVEKQLVSLKKSKSNLIKVLTTLLEYDLSLMKLNASLPFGAVLKKCNLSRDSEENKIFHSRYIKEVLESVERNLYWKGYRVNLIFRNMNLEYEATLIDVRFVKHMVLFFTTLLLSCPAVYLFFF